jgi:RNA polymerase sporulation-specific sigma factor
MRDEELAVLCQNGCRIAMDPLVTRYDGMVRATARRYYLQGADHDDLLQEGRIGLFNAVRSFRLEKHQRFDTFAELCVRRRVQSAIRAAARQKHSPLNQALSLPTGRFFDVRLTGDDRPSDRDIDLTLCLCDKLTPFEREVVRGYLEGRSYLEMGRNLACLPKSIDNALQRAKRKILSVLAGP